MTAGGSCVPAFLAGCESPQSVRASQSFMRQSFSSASSASTGPFTYDREGCNFSPSSASTVPFTYDMEGCNPYAQKVDMRMDRCMMQDENCCGQMANMPAMPPMNQMQFPMVLAHGMVPVQYVPYMVVPVPVPVAKQQPPLHGKKAPKAEMTVVVRNIPRDLEPAQVLKRLSELRASIDFLYVPIEFQTKKCLGYAFVNFTHKIAAQRLEERCEQLFPGAGIYLQPARVQGVAANVKRFRNASVMAVLPEDCKPMVFQQGVQVPFPAPTKKLPPLGPRFRFSHTEELAKILAAEAEAAAPGAC